MKTIGIIPARMKSGRFPGKPLAKIRGIPMVGHCYFRSKMSKVLDELYVATCDREVFDYIESVGGKPIMTSDKHTMCTDRVAEAALKAEEDLGGRVDIVVNIQGDQPMVFPDMIDAVVKPMLDEPTLQCSTMVDDVQDLGEFDDPNRIKVIVTQDWNALYFSREAIPSRRKYEGTPPNLYKHVALIPFRRDFLFQFAELEMTPLETVESVDYLRALENGYSIKVVHTTRRTETVDTPEDLAKVEKIMAKDELLAKYASHAT